MCKRVPPLPRTLIYWWYNNRKTPYRVMVFNCTHGRNGASFLATILDEAKSQFKAYGREDFSSDDLFTHVIFCSNVTYVHGGFKGGKSQRFFSSRSFSWILFVDLTNRVVAEEIDDPLRDQQRLADAWLNLLPDFPKENVHVLPSIEHAVNVVNELRDGGKEVDALVTGSLHLVGGLIEAAGLGDVAL